VLPEGNQTAHAKDLWPAVTMNAPAKKNFGEQRSLEPNSIFVLDDTEPDFLIEFRTKLRLD